MAERADMKHSDISPQLVFEVDIPPWGRTTASLSLCCYPLPQVDDVGDKGRGVIAAKPFHPGDFVVEYAGELIDKKTAEEREEAYLRDDSVGCYMYYFVFKQKHYW